MKRFNVEVPDSDYIMRLYFPDIETVKSKYPHAIKIAENTDMSYIVYIDKIKQLAIDSAQRDGREIYKLNLPIGIAMIKLSKDLDDGIYYDYCEYQILKKTALVYPICFTMSDPKEFCEKYLTEPLKYEIISFRKYGQPKLDKPKELKGIKQSGTVSFVGRVKCQYFILNDDVYMKHRDYFSESYHNSEDIGTPLEYRRKKYGLNEVGNKMGTYPDCWGDVILRNEAWIKFSNMIPLIKQSSHPELLRDEIADLQKKYHKFAYRLDEEWYRFWEDLCKQLAELVNKT